MINQPNRRYFLKQTFYGSILGSLPSQVWCRVGRSGLPNASPFLNPVPFADSQITGELGQRILRNLDRLEAEKYRPDKVYITGQPGIDWPGDTEGRTILGLTLDAQAAHRTPKYLDEIVALYPQKSNALGYLGQIEPKGVFSEQQLASHGWVLRGLCEYYLWKRDKKVLGWIQNIITNLALPTKGFNRQYPINAAERQHEGSYGGNEKATVVNHWKLSTDTGATYIFLDGLTQAYTLLPSQGLKAVIEEMIGRFLEIDLVGIKAQTHATLTSLRALLRYYETTRKPDLLRAVEERYGDYRTQGMTENYENYNWFGRPQWTEPCAVVDSFIVATQLWRFTGKSDYLEDAHHIYFNGLTVEQRANGGFGLQTCSGAKDPYTRVELDEAHWCCTMRGGEGVSRAAQYSFFTGPNAVVFPFYYTGEVTLRFGTQQVHLTEETGYPYKGSVRLTVKQSNLTFSPEIRLVAPSWTRNHALRLNNNRLLYQLSNGFLTAKVPLKKGDVLELTFELVSGAAPTFNPNTLAGYHSVRYGPLILGYDGQEEISVDSQAQIDYIGDRAFQVRGQAVTLQPLSHLMHPGVNKAVNFGRQILFKNP